MEPGTDFDAGVDADPNGECTMATTRYEEMTKEQLYELAKDRDIEGRSQMGKDDLVGALEDEEGTDDEEDIGRSTTPSRPVWRGAITFGLITIPVGLYSAVEDRDVSFQLLDRRDGARVRYKRVNERTEEEIDWDQIVRGYEYEPGHTVSFTEEELDQLRPQSGRTIDVARFVDRSEIDPVYLDRTYYIAPDPTAVKAYRLMVEALGGTGRLGIAKVTLRKKEQLCLLRPSDGLLVLETMHWPDEIRIPDFEQLESEIDISDQEVEMAGTLVEQLAGDFEPAAFEDSYRKQVEDAAAQKIEGGEIQVTPEPTPEGTKVADLMDALQESVERTRERRSA